MSVRTNFAIGMAAFTELYLASGPRGISLLMNDPDLQRFISVLPHSRRPDRILMAITMTRGLPNSSHDFVVSGPILYPKSILCDTEFISTMVEDFPENGKLFYFTNSVLFGLGEGDGELLFDRCPQ